MNILLLLAATVWMAPNGNDATGDGSQAKPVATLKRAVEITRGVLADEDRKIVVKDGVYRFEEAMRLLPGDSGLLIAAEHQGKAVFTGARAVAGWKPDSKDPRLLVADAPFALQPKMHYSLAVNGTVASLAAFPDYGGTVGRHAHYHADEEDVRRNNRTVVRYDPDDYPKDYDFDDLDLAGAYVLLPQGNWALTRSAIATNDAAHHALVLATPTRHPLGKGNVGYQLVNCRAGLTKPGDWMFEPTAGRVRYWPRPGETAANLKAELSQARGLLFVQYTSDVRLSGLVLEGCAARFEDSNYSDRLGALVYGGHPHGLVVEDCEIRNTAGSGVFIAKPVGCVIRRCTVRDIGMDGVNFFDGGERCDVFDSEFCRIGFAGLNPLPLHVQLSRAKIVGNHFHHFRGCGVIMWSCNSLFASNEVDHTTLQWYDGGGVYGAMNNCVFRDNYVHDTGMWPGLYNDEGGQHTLYTGNRFENAPWPIHLHINQSDVVTNNVFIGAKRPRCTLQDSAHCVFRDNLYRVSEPFAEDDFVDMCEVWENKVEVVGPDGAVVSNYVLRLEHEIQPPRKPVNAVRTRGPVFENGKCDRARLVDQGSSVPVDRNAKGWFVGGVPSSTPVVGFDADWLYVGGTYEYNRAGPYPSYQSFGRIWGHCDAVRFCFRDLTVTVYPNTGTNGLVVASDPKLVFSRDDFFIRVASWMTVEYAFRIPRARLGLAGDLDGRKMPFNVVFYNEDHQEYKYFSAPAADGNLLTAEVAFSEPKVDYTKRVALAEKHPLAADFSAGPVFPGGCIQACPVYVLRKGDARVGSRNGYDPHYRQLLGYDHLGAFRLLSFTGADPAPAGRFEQERTTPLEWQSEVCWPGFYSAAVEEWCMHVDATASKNCAYHLYLGSKDGRINVLLTVAKDAKVSVSPDGVVEGCDRGVWGKVAFDRKPVAVREIPTEDPSIRRYVLGFKVSTGRGKNRVASKGAFSRKDLAEARARFAADGEAIDFEARKQAATEAWNGILREVKPNGDNRKYADRYYEVAKTAATGAANLREISRRPIRCDSEPLNFCFARRFPDRSIYLGYSIGRHMVNERHSSMFSPDDGQTWQLVEKGSGMGAFATRDGLKRFVSAWDHTLTNEHFVTVRTIAKSGTEETVKTRIVMPRPIQLRLHREVARLGDGSLILTGYSGSNGYHTAYVVKSDDDGLNWRFLSFLPEVKGAQEGVNEATTVQLKDGRILAFARTGCFGAKNSVCALMRFTSRDGGKTWGEACVAADYGVDPQAGLLSDGTLFLLSGRPGVYLMLDPTGTGEHFRRHEIYAGPGSSYSTLMEPQPGKLLLIYDESAFMHISGATPTNRIMQVEFEFSGK